MVSPEFSEECGHPGIQVTKSFRFISTAAASSGRSATALVIYVAG